MFKAFSTTTPNAQQLNQVSAVWLVDAPQPEAPIGDGVLPVIAVGETENGETYRTGSDGKRYRGGGAFTPMDVLTANDMQSRFGGLGFTTEEGQFRGCVARRSGGNVLWNGNLYMHLNGFTFTRLIVQKVDNSAGLVSFRRHAHAVGEAGPYQVADGHTIVWERNGSIPESVTFNGDHARITGNGGTYPTLFVGGETLVVQDGDNPPRVITMTVAEQLLVDVIARVKLVLAGDNAENVGGELSLISTIKGLDAKFQIIGGTALGTLGLVATPVADELTLVLVAAAVGVYTFEVETKIDGVLTTYEATYTAGGLDTLTTIRNGLLADLAAQNPVGLTQTPVGPATATIVADLNQPITAFSITSQPNPGDMTLVASVAGEYSFDQGTGNVGNLGDVQTAELVALHQAVTALDGYIDELGRPVIGESATPTTGTLQAISGFEDFGFDGELYTAAAGEALTIAAGTRVRDTTTSTIWCTIEDYQTEPTGGPFAVRVRPWNDDDTALGAAPAGIDEVMDMPTGYWSVTNTAAVTRLSSAQLDVRYRQAIAATLDVNSPAAAGRLIFSARSSATINAAIHANALEASASGSLSLRRDVVAPPVGTSKDDAKGTGPIGAGAVRSDRRMYAFPGITRYVEAVASVGESGGLGFADDGLVEVSTVGLYAFMRAKLPTERSVGEWPDGNDIGPLSALGIVGLEKRYDSTFGGETLLKNDYIAFKAAGVIALNRVPGQGLVIQEDVSSVDPLSDPVRVSASRGFLFDEIAMTIFRASVPYKDRLTNQSVIDALESQVDGYLSQLVTDQRVTLADARFDSTPEQRAQGVLVFKVGIQRTPHTKAIVYQFNLTTQGIQAE
jgi:hypothetical protein